MTGDRGVRLRKQKQQIAWAFKVSATELGWSPDLFKMIIKAGRAGFKSTRVLVEEGTRENLYILGINHKTVGGEILVEFTDIQINSLRKVFCRSPNPKI